MVTFSTDNGERVGYRTLASFKAMFCPFWLTLRHVADVPNYLILTSLTRNDKYDDVLSFEQAKVLPPLLPSTM